LKVGDSINALLVNLRNSKKISRKELAKFLNISYSMVEKVERGSRRASPYLAKKWGNKLGIKDSQLYQYFFDIESDYKSCLSNADNSNIQNVG
jgi:transcriptional regulator with XRE-family HTH domain